MTYLTLNGKYIGVEPSRPERVYADRTAGGPWEEIDIGQSSNAGHVLVRFLAANRALSLTPEGLLQTRDVETDGPWEQFRIRRKVVDREGVSVALKLEGTAPEPAPTLTGGFLRTHGPDFITEDGQPWLFAGYTIHTLICNIARGEDIGPLLDEAIGYGANTIVTIGCHLSQWKRDNGFAYDSRQAGYQGHLAALYDLCGLKGLRVAFAVLADAQGLSQAEQTGIWNRACDVARGRWNMLLRVGNEENVNGYTSGAFSKPDLAGCLASRGSQGIGNPSAFPAWDFAEWEARREPVYKAMDDAGAGVLELAHGYESTLQGRVGPFPMPIVQIEPPFFHDSPTDQYGDSRWTDPRLALQLGANISVNGAGGAFGASDGLVARPLQPHAAECARQFYRGLRAGFVR